MTKRNQFLENVNNIQPQIKIGPFSIFQNFKIPELKYHLFIFFGRWEFRKKSILKIKIIY